MSDALAEQEAGMMLWLGNRSKQETLGQILAMNLLDGVIVTANFLEDPLVDGLLASTLPTVLIGHRREDLTASYVDVDNVRAAETMTTHLLQLGRRRIGHITRDAQDRRRRGSPGGLPPRHGQGRPDRVTGSSSRATSTIPPAWSEPPRCSTAASTRSSVPTTGRPGALSRCSRHAACASPRTSPWPASTISNSPPRWIRH